MLPAKCENHFSRGMLLVLAVCFSVGSVVMPGVAQVPERGQTWAASTGSVDESNISKYEFRGTDAFVRSDLATGAVLLRYNVVPTPALTTPHDPGLNCWSLGVAFLDNGGGARVQVNLYSQNVITGVKHLLRRAVFDPQSGTYKLIENTFDSNIFPASSSFQSSGVPGCNVMAIGDFQFVSEGFANVYYIDAYLTKSASGGTPGLRAIWLTIFNEQ